MGAAIAGVFGGVAAGVAVSLAMSLGRRASVLHKTLAEYAEDWVDRAADTRSHIGKSGTWTLEQGNHIAASAAFEFAHGPSVNADPPCRRVC